MGGVDEEWEGSDLSISQDSECAVMGMGHQRTKCSFSVL